MASPAFIKLTNKTLTNSDIRYLLHEMSTIGVSRVTAEVIGQLAIMPPQQRLIDNFTKTMVNMAGSQVSCVKEEFMDHGLWPDETTALLELDRKPFSFRSRITARMLMHVKERWFLAKSVQGFFRKSRERPDGYLDIKE